MTAQRLEPSSHGLLAAAVVGALVCLVGLIVIGVGGPALLAGTDLTVGAAGRIVLGLLAVAPFAGALMGARIVRRRHGRPRQALLAGVAGPLVLIGVLTVGDAVINGVAAAGLAATAASVVLALGGAALGAGRAR